MQTLFEVASGSIVGRDHVRIGKNNQDAYCISSSDQFTIAVVCDGCGSSPHSEVGAKLGAQLTVTILQSLLTSTTTIDEDFWQEVRHQLLVNLYAIAKTLGSSLLEIVHDYFLFTIVGTVITSEITCVFSLGDGAIAVNDSVKVIDSFPNNAPPYIGYGIEAMLLEEGKNSIMPSFVIQFLLPTHEVQNVLIGTDGVSDLIKSEQRNLPGRQDIVGSISQFWRENRYFTNPDAIRRQLTLINREITKLDRSSQKLIKEVGLLPDDTTLIAIRRKLSN